MLDTRLGASFTTALPFIFALLAISVIGPANVLENDGLKPGFTLLDDVPVDLDRSEGKPPCELAVCLDGQPR